jgi:uncharacterized membrane protein YjjP (DUF1212 family)
MKTTPWWSWNVTKEEMTEQVEKYDQLKFSKSYRGAMVLFFLLVFGMSLAVSLLDPNLISIYSVLASIVIYSILLYFGYHGHRWALVILLVYSTVDKIATIAVTLQSSSGSLVAQLLFLILGIVLIVRAIKVEAARKVMGSVIQVDAQSN